MGTKNITHDFNKVMCLIVIIAMMVTISPLISASAAAPPYLEYFSLLCTDIFGNPIVGMEFTAVWVPNYALVTGGSVNDIYKSGEDGIVYFPVSIMPFMGGGTIRISLSPTWIAANQEMLESTVFGMSPLGGNTNPIRNDPILILHRKNI